MTYFTYKGISFHSQFYSVESLSYAENEFQLLDEDIVSITFPKSGTHWMQEILGLILHDGDPAWVQSFELAEWSPMIETLHGQRAALKCPPPRVLMSHLPFHLFPKSFLNSKAKVIYTLRNPKDVLVSSYYFVKALQEFKDPGTLEEYMKWFLSGNGVLGSWFDHAKGWVKMKDRANVFLITYEELRKDLRGSVEKISQFLGKELSSQQIDLVVEHASFQKMKDNKMSNFSLMPESIFDHKKGKLMRKGISGDWKKHLTVAQSEHFDRVYQEKMCGVNVTFPWD